MAAYTEPKKGLIQVYTGEGKGKTTAALGLALRASGQGLRVLFIQFVKGRLSGEHRFTDKYRPFELVKLNRGDSFRQSQEELSATTQESLAYTERELATSNYDLVILDEILVALDMGLLAQGAILKLMEKKPPATELVLTGRYAPEEILQRADLVTEMRAIKHPFQKGIAARPGIEY